MTETQLPLNSPEKVRAAIEVVGLHMVELERLRSETSTLRIDLANMTVECDQLKERLDEERRRAEFYAQAYAVAATQISNLNAIIADAAEKCRVRTYVPATRNDDPIPSFLSRQDEQS